MSPLPCHLLPPPCPPQWSGRWTTPWSSHSRQVSATKTGRLVQSGLECWQEPALDGRRRNQTHCRTPRTPVPPYLRMLSHNNSTKSLNARTNNNTTLWDAHCQKQWASPGEIFKDKSEKLCFEGNLQETRYQKSENRFHKKLKSDL